MEQQADPNEKSEATADQPDSATEAATLDQLRRELEAARAQADQHLASWQRSAADFINYKLRVEQERSEQARFANAATVINILPIYDDLERAVETVDAKLAGLNWVQGVVAIQRKFQKMLEAMGVTEIPAANETFDPTVHEAVMFGDGEEGKVISVIQKGYKLNGRVIRPAMVVVGKGKKDAEEPSPKPSP